MGMIAIVAVRADHGIGAKGKLLTRLDEDLRRFRRLTVGKTVIMGRKTLLSLPGGKPLPSRNNIVLSADPKFTVPGAEVCHSLDEALGAVAECPPDSVFIIGGASVYEQFLPYCNSIYLTRFRDPSGPKADAFFPDITHNPEWKLAGRSAPIRQGNIEYIYEDYRRAKAWVWDGPWR